MNTKLGERKVESLVIIGAGEFGRELYWHAQASKGYGTRFEIKGYIDDAEPSDEKFQKIQKPLLGSIDEYKIEKDDVFICAIGMPVARETVIRKMTEKGAKFINLIHNTSIIQGQVSIGWGVFIGPYTVIGDNVSIDDHVMLNTHSAIGHDAVVNKYVCIMSYVDVTGGCYIGEAAFLGSGSRMVPGTRIGSRSYVGIGSVVLKRVRNGKKVFGNPARTYEI